MMARATWKWVAVTVVCAGALGAGAVLALVPGWSQPPLERAATLRSQGPPGAAPERPPVSALEAIAEGKQELAEMERDLAKLNGDTPAVVGEWVWAGELKVRVTGAEIRHVMAMDIEGGPYKTGEKELAVKVEVAIQSKTRRLVYQASEGDHRVIDDRGKECAPSIKLRVLGIGGGYKGYTQLLSKDVAPGDGSFTDAFFFEVPKAGTKELRFTIKGVVDGSNEEYHFRLTSWPTAPDPPKGTAAVVGVLEKAAQVHEDKGDREKLAAAAAVLRRMSEGPPPPQLAADQRARERRSEELAAKVAAKRDEIRRAEAERTAGEFAPPGEWAQVGDVRVRVIGAKVTRPRPVTNAGEEWAPDDTFLVVRVAVENRSKEKVQYRRWEPELNDPDGPLPPPHAALVDLHGNRYGCGGALGSGLVGNEGAVPNGCKEVEGGGSFEDLVYFEAPLKAAGELRLTLSAMQNGVKGSYRFKIPAAEWKPKK